MREIGAFEAKNKFSELLDLAERGEEITITRHGKKIARLIPSEPGNDPAQIEAAMQRLRARAKALKLDLSLAEIKAYRDEGRR
jgi:prevent-host-death family protein